jgi:hypothetical protein
MSFLVKDDGGTRTPPVEPGSYLGLLNAIVDIGTQPNNIDPKKPARQVAFIWELPTERATFDGKEQARNLSQFFTLSLGEKANLRKALESWRGKAYTPEELKAGIDFVKMLSKPAMLAVGTSKTGKAKINGLAAPPKGTPIPAMEGVPHLFNLSEWQGGANLPDWIPAFLQEKIAGSPEWAKVSKATPNAQVGTAGTDGEDAPF